MENCPPGKRLAIRIRTGFDKQYIIEICIADTVEKIIEKLYEELKQRKIVDNIDGYDIYLYYEDKELSYNKYKNMRLDEVIKLFGGNPDKVRIKLKRKGRGTAIKQPPSGPIDKGEQAGAAPPPKQPSSPRRPLRQSSPQAAIARGGGHTGLVGVEVSRVHLAMAIVSILFFMVSSYALSYTLYAMLDAVSVALPAVALLPVLPVAIRIAGNLVKGLIIGLLVLTLVFSAVFITISNGLV